MWFAYILLIHKKKSEIEFCSLISFDLSFAILTIEVFVILIVNIANSSLLLRTNSVSSRDLALSDTTSQPAVHPGPAAKISQIPLQTKAVFPGVGDGVLNGQLPPRKNEDRYSVLKEIIKITKEKYIYVIYRPGGPSWEKLCQRS